MWFVFSSAISARRFVLRGTLIDLCVTDLENVFLNHPFEWPESHNRISECEYEGRILDPCTNLHSFNTSPTTPLVIYTFEEDEKCVVITSDPNSPSIPRTPNSRILTFEGDQVLSVFENTIPPRTLLCESKSGCYANGSPIWSSVSEWDWNPEETLPDPTPPENSSDEENHLKFMGRLRGGGKVRLTTTKASKSKDPDIPRRSARHHAGSSALDAAVAREECQLGKTPKDDIQNEDREAKSDLSQSPTPKPKTLQSIKRKGDPETTNPDLKDGLEPEVQPSETKKTSQPRRKRGRSDSDSLSLHHDGPRRKVQGYGPKIDTDDSYDGSSGDSNDPSKAPNLKKSSLKIFTKNTLTLLIAKEET